MTWHVGDVATRVVQPEKPENQALWGKVYTVTEVIFGGHVLRFAEIGHPKHAGYVAASFRKVVRDKHEACEPEFVTLLKRNRVST